MGGLAVLFLGFSAWHALILPRPDRDRPGDVRRVPEFLRAFLATFGSFFRKPRIIAVMLFLLLYRFGEAQLVKMAQPFLKDPRTQNGLGLSTAEIGFLYGTIGVIALLLGGILGGWVISRDGLKRWLWPMMFAIHLPDAVFIYLAYAQPASLVLVQLCIAIEQFGYGFGFAAFLMYMIYVARGEHPTAHYAICTGFMALGMMIPGMWSGWLQDHIGYRHFFVWVILATIPSFLVALRIPLDAGFGRKATA
jgi:PAT family beta-lactamase induction signal transducer AmpG